MKNRQRSFTLLETIVAIYVLLAGITGAMNLAQQNIGAITLFRHQLIAANLAQEGAELVRNKRDTNALGSFFQRTDLTVNPNINNMAGISVPCGSPLGCRVDSLFDSYSFTPCDSEAICKYLQLNADGRYKYVGGDKTIFDRRIVVTQINPTRNDGSIDWKVTSTVSWCEKLDCTKKVEVVEVLTPHIPRL